eukprot:m.268739 g.268739  ORF g.268739 m.268739 type:complete len:67 (-) comp38520_c0_seq1:188-388(-)
MEYTKLKFEFDKTIDLTHRLKANKTPYSANLSSMEGGGFKRKNEDEHETLQEPNTATNKSKRSFPT